MIAKQDARLVPAAIIVWLGTMAGLLLWWGWALIVGASAGIVALGLLMVSRDLDVAARAVWRGICWSLLVCGAALAVLTSARISWAQSDPLRAAAARSAPAQLRVEVDQRPRPVYSSGFGGRPGGVQSVLINSTVTTATVDGRPIASTGRVLLLAPAAQWSGLLPGQAVDAEGELSAAPIEQLTVAVLHVKGPPAAVAAAPGWQRAAERLRMGLRHASAVLSAEPAGLLPALVDGDTDLVPPQVTDEFKTTGLAHLLAVSGANLAIVCGAVLFLLRALRCGPRLSALVAMLALVGFVVLAGPEPSVLRAGVMGAVGLLALALGRERLALPALAAAEIVLVLHDPAMAVSFGFALSVLATAALVLVAPKWSDRLAQRGVPRGLAEAVAVPAAAHLATAPVVAGMAGQVSLVAVVANLLAAPVVAPATVLGVLAALVAPIAPWLAEWLVRLAGPEASWLITVGRHGAGVPWATVAWPSGWWGGLLLLAVLVVLVVALRSSRLRILVAACLAGLLLVAVPIRVLAPGWPPQGWAMVACDVGQGDAMVLATADAGRAVVVDTGPDPGPIRGCLDRLSITRVPLVVLSHLHADHIGGLSSVLDNQAVGAVAVGRSRVPSWAWDQIRRETAAAGVPLVELDAGRRLEWPGLAIDVLAPRPAEAQPADQADGTEINNSSVVIRASTSAGRVLLTGDVEIAAQADLLAGHTDLRADVLKVPHHGSRYTAPEFLGATGARIALVSVGAGNPYGHPSTSTIDYLRQRNVAVLRTDQDGDSAVLRGDGGPLAVARGDPRGPPHH